MNFVSELLACLQRKEGKKTCVFVFIPRFPFPHGFTQTGFDIEQPPRSGVALDPYCTQGSGGVAGEAVGIVE